MLVKGYITNLGKYNEGHLVGKWIDFPIDEDDLNEVFYEIGLCYNDGDGQYINTGYEEYFFTDWDCDFSHNFGEYESVLKINEIAEKLSYWDDVTFMAACEIWNFDELLDSDPDAYNLYTDINNDYDLGYYLIVEAGCYDISKLGNLANYIDYEAFGRDVRFESDGGFTSMGWIENIG